MCIIYSTLHVNYSLYIIINTNILFNAIVTCMNKYIILYYYYNHDLKYNALRLPMTRKEYYVQCTKYQVLKLIRETSQLDLDRCLTSPITQFIGYFKYRMIDKNVVAMHFIYQINRLTTTKVDSTYLG